MGLGHLQAEEEEPSLQPPPSDLNSPRFSHVKLLPGGRGEARRCTGEQEQHLSSVACPRREGQRKRERKTEGQTGKTEAGFE